MPYKLDSVSNSSKKYHRREVDPSPNSRQSAKTFRNLIVLVVIYLLAYLYFSNFWFE